MLYIEPKSHNAAFHFATEDYCMRNLSRFEKPIFMIWRTEPCVMLGRYQLLEAEVNKKIAAEKGIQIVRRSTGGGTIFTDMGTLLYTMICPCPVSDDGTGYDYDAIKFSNISRPVVDALNQLGVPAHLEGRNDILIDGMKISGLAQFISQGILCSHGSLLYDADLSTLTEVLRVDTAKIQSKAITSVRDRVTNIKDYMAKPYTVEEFWQLFREAVFKQQNIEEYVFSPHEITEIEKIKREKYENDSWTNDIQLPFNYTNEKRYPAGKLIVQLVISKEKIIEECKLSGDFMGVRPMDTLEKHIQGAPYQANHIAQQLNGFDLTPYLGNLQMEQLLECMFA